MGTNIRTNFLIIVSGYNCSRYVRACYLSIINQTYKNFQAIFIDDGSTDDTAYELDKIKNEDSRIRIFISNKNEGAAYRRWQAINSLTTGLKEETVIVLVGMDDELMPDALRVLSRKYSEDVWMTYGSWIGSDKYKLPEAFLEYPEQVHKDRSYRKETYRATAANTFKKFLYDQFTEDDFKLEGEWIKATTESNLMLSCLEMCGKNKIGITKEIIYFYNRGRSDSARKRLGSFYQDKIYKDVMSKTKRELLCR